MIFVCIFARFIAKWTSLTASPKSLKYANYLIQTGNYYSLQGSTETHKYRHYRTKYPEWEISPSGEISKYWMWFYNKYKKEMAKMNKAKPPQIAKELEKIDKKEAVDSL
jgi:hypothetical protein